MSTAQIGINKLINIYLYDCLMISTLEGGRVWFQLVISLESDCESLELHLQNICTSIKLQSIFDFRHFVFDLVFDQMKPHKNGIDSIVFLFALSIAVAVCIAKLKI